MASASAPASPNDCLRRSPSMRRAKFSSFSSIAIGDDIIDATEVQLREPDIPKDEKPRDIAQPIPSIPRVGPHNFEKLRVLGAGATGRVYLVRSVNLGPEEFFAMKVVKKSELIRRNRVQRILTERQILSVANHPFVVTLHYCFQTADFFYLVMQYCAGGELFSFLRRQQNHRLCEGDAKFYAAEVLIALEYLHLIGIIYRDLKPENILVHESGHVMLSDFDLAHEVKIAEAQSNRTYSALLSKKQPLAPLSPTISTTDPDLWLRMRKQHPNTRDVVGVASSEPAAPRKRRFSCGCVSMPPEMYPHVDTESQINAGEKRTSFVGTHEYVAPEIITEEGYVGSVDWWAFGILLYEMMYGVTPFRGQTHVQTLENILDISGEIKFPAHVPISADCRDLLERLLAKDMSKRLQNPLLIKSHPFFNGLAWSLIRHQRPPIIPEMIHSLDDKTYSEAELHEFDDEVPIHRALSPPRRRSRQLSRSSLSSTGSITPMPSIVPVVEDGSQDSVETRHGKRDDNDPYARISPTSQMPDISQAWAQAQAFGDLMPSSAPSPPRQIGKDSPNRMGSSIRLPSPTSQDADATPDDFAFVSSQRNSFWSSGDSRRSLSARLSQLDLAALAIDHEEGEDHNLEEEETGGHDTNDKQEHAHDVVVEEDDDDDSDHSPQEPCAVDQRRQLGEE